MYQGGGIKEYAGTESDSPAASPKFDAPATNSRLKFLFNLAKPFPNLSTRGVHREGGRGRGGCTMYQGRG